MFYCKACQDKYSWPDGFMKSHGPCEMCGKPSLCSDVPSRFLPVPATPASVERVLGDLYD